MQQQHSLTEIYTRNAERFSADYHGHHAAVPAACCDTVNMVPLPDFLLRQIDSTRPPESPSRDVKSPHAHLLFGGADAECRCFMGLLPEISRVWLTVDHRLFLWNYEDKYAAPAFAPFIEIRRLYAFLVLVCWARLTPCTAAPTFTPMRA